MMASTASIVSASPASSLAAMVRTPCRIRRVVPSAELGADVRQGAPGELAGDKGGDLPVTGQRLRPARGAQRIGARLEVCRRRLDDVAHRDPAGREADVVIVGGDGRELAWIADMRPKPSKSAAIRELLIEGLKAIKQLRKPAPSLAPETSPRDKDQP
jgi:hypothetical protein